MVWKVIWKRCIERIFFGEGTQVIKEDSRGILEGGQKRRSKKSVEANKRKHDHAANGVLEKARLSLVELGPLGRS